eukprot:CAMPEP_0179876314 /NCGR_PEP_ID=MMETSP0982-20121206/24135_1 /TAXON_ID=483367 /ORGANISM="non described non described, Strain CCMP 2436" /LENGTH=70 /DNA_ID=CAMNT_0021768727 /DNA_START=1 /DNA_END=210 /DNA_ORIENTATION=-
MLLPHTAQAADASVQPDGTQRSCTTAARRWSSSAVRRSAAVASTTCSHSACARASGRYTSAPARARARAP